MEEEELSDDDDSSIVDESENEEVDDYDESGSEEEDVDEEEDEKINEDEVKLHKPDISFDFDIEGIVGVDVAKARQELRMKLLEKINSIRRKRKASELDESFKPAIANPRESKKLKKTKSQKKLTKAIPTSNSQAPERPRQEVQKRDLPYESKTALPKSANSMSHAKGDFQFSNIKAKDPKQSYEKTKKVSKVQRLKNAESELVKLKSLEGTEEGEKLKEQKTWENAFKKTQGEKVKDKIDLIKKTLKKGQKKKEKSSVEWKERIDTQKKQQKEKQKKRQENIKKRQEEKKSKKGSKKSKKR